MLSVGLDHVQERSSDPLPRIVIDIGYMVASRLDLVFDKSAIVRGGLTVVSPTESPRNLKRTFF